MRINCSKARIGEDPFWGKSYRVHRLTQLQETDKKCKLVNQASSEAEGMLG